MAERWRKTEKMQSALDAYNSEFPIPAGEWNMWTDPGMPSPEEEAMAREFARELYELGEKIHELQDRYHALLEWQRRFYAKYPMASPVLYQPKPKEEPKPKITKPPAYAFQTFAGTAYMNEAQIGEVVLTQKELAAGNYSIDKDTVEVTTLGDPNPTYLTSGNTLKLDGKPIGTVTNFKQTAGGMEATAQITDKTFFEKISKIDGPKVSSVTVDDLKKTMDEVEKSAQKTTYVYDPQDPKYKTLKDFLDAKIKASLKAPPGQIISASTAPMKKPWAFDLPDFPKDGLFKKKNGK